MYIQATHKYYVQASIFVSCAHAPALRVRAVLRMKISFSRLGVVTCHVIFRRLKVLIVELFGVGFVVVVAVAVVVVVG